MTMVIIGVLAAAAFSTFAGTKERTSDAGTERLLESVASTQEGYHRSRGAFATTPAALASLSSSAVTLTTGPSTGQAVVSVSPLEVEETTMLGLAVLGATGKCLTLLLPPPGSESTDPVRSSVMEAGAALCTAEMAAPL